jgi:hypothetical protein
MEPPPVEEVPPVPVAAPAPPVPPVPPPAPVAAIATCALLAKTPASIAVNSLFMINSFSRIAEMTKPAINRSWIESRLA